MSLTRICFISLLSLSGLMAVCSSPVEQEVITHEVDRQILVSDPDQKYQLAWSPDSAFLAYQVPVISINVLHVDLQGQVLDTLGTISTTRQGGTDPNVQLSPNGDKLLYTTGGVTFKILSIFDQRRTTLTLPDINFRYTVQWAPDNEHLYYSDEEREQFFVEIVHPTTLESRRIWLEHVNLPSSIQLLSMDKVLYSGRTANDEFQFWYKNAATSDIRVLSKNYVDEWTSTGDGTFIAFFEKSRSRWQSDSGSLKLYSLSQDSTITLSDQFRSVIFLNPQAQTDVLHFYGQHAIRGNGFYSMSVSGEWQPLSTWEPPFGWQWFPDGASVIVEDSREYSTIMLYDLSAQETRDLLPDAPGTHNEFPTFTADSKSIVFSQNDRLHKLSLETNELMELTPPPAMPQRRAEISPDGSVIAFDDDTDIFILPLQGGTPQNISESINDPLQSPTWSPDGTQLACISKTQMGTQLGIFSYQGGALNPVKQFEGDFLEIDWARTEVPVFGSTILYRDVQSNINTINPETGERYESFDFRHFVASACWAPNGRHIAFSTLYQVYRTPLYTVLEQD